MMTSDFLGKKIRLPLEEGNSINNFKKFIQNNNIVEESKKRNLPLKFDQKIDLKQNKRDVKNIKKTKEFVEQNSLLSKENKNMESTTTIVPFIFQKITTSPKNQITEFDRQDIEYSLEKATYDSFPQTDQDAPITLSVGQSWWYNNSTINVNTTRNQSHWPGEVVLTGSLISKTSRQRLDNLRQLSPNDMPSDAELNTASPLLLLSPTHQMNTNFSDNYLSYAKPTYKSNYYINNIHNNSNDYSNENDVEIENSKSIQNSSFISIKNTNETFNEEYYNNTNYPITKIDAENLEYIDNVTAENMPNKVLKKLEIKENDFLKISSKLFCGFPEKVNLKIIEGKLLIF